MSSKSEQTKQFIIETVAPLFNKFGYAATALSDITNATGLTKGAVYGNFENKEEIALEAFNYNMKVLLKEIRKKLDAKISPLKKLFALTDFFRNYKKLTEKFGGCPILNVGVDSKNQNPKLHERVKYSINKIIEYIASLIREGILLYEIKRNVDPEKYATQILTLIEGSVFMMSAADNENMMNEMMDRVDHIIETELMN